MRIDLTSTLHLWHALLRGALDFVPTPTDPAQGHGSGPDPDRILIIGSGSAIGYGVISHQLALTGRLAEELSRITGRGADVDVTIQRPPIAGIQSIRNRNLSHYDAIVVTLGSRDPLALAAPHRWTARVVALVDALSDAASPSSPIVLTGAHSFRFASRIRTGLFRAVEAHEDLLDRMTKQICSGSARTSFVPLSTPGPAEVNQRGASDTYGHWARSIARHLAPRLPAIDVEPSTEELTARQHRNRPQCSIGRQRALADLDVTLSQAEERFDRIVALARAYFRTSCAALTLSDGRHDLFKSKIGFRGRPRLESLSAAVLETGRPLIVANAMSDSRFRQAKLAGGSSVGFYAGYPLEAPSGHRVGVLSVFDSRARKDIRTTNKIMLRDLAMMLQRELWGGSQEAEHA